MWNKNTSSKTVWLFTLIANGSELFDWHHVSDGCIILFMARAADGGPGQAR